jgi:dienelactone hydrolase
LVLPDESASLTLTGRVTTLFRPYFDLFPIDSSDDLATWRRQAILLRTNTSINPLVYYDTEAAHSLARFYRTVTNLLITPNVNPTGPYSVGRISLLLSDPSRTNRYNVPTNSSFMVSYWYPAEAGVGELPGTWEDGPLARDPNFWGTYTDRVPYFVAHSFRSARVSMAQTNYPPIVYVPGFTGTRAENQEKFEDLASQGYIVVSADPWEVYGTVFPDGRYLHGVGGDLSNTNFAAKAFSGRIQDVRLILASLDRANTSDPILGGRIDLNNVGLMGFSFGGGVSGETCRTNDRCRAALFMDPSAQGADELVRVGLQKPFLLMSHGFDAGYLSFFNKATNDAVWFEVSNTSHGSFAYGYETTDPSPANRELQRTMKAYILSFFNKYLKGQDDHLLDGPSTNFPRVINFMRK